MKNRKNRINLKAIENHGDLKDEYPYWLDGSKMPSAEIGEKLLKSINEKTKKRNENQNLNISHLMVAFLVQKGIKSFIFVSASFTHQPRKKMFIHSV